jgi:hypothetical protein
VGAAATRGTVRRKVVRNFMVKASVLDDCGVFTKWWAAECAWNSCFSGWKTQGKDIKREAAGFICAQFNDQFIVGSRLKKQSAKMAEAHMARHWSVRRKVLSPYDCTYCRGGPGPIIRSQT